MCVSLVSALAGCDTLSLFMDTLILYPTDTLYFTPPDLGYTNYDEIMLPSGEHDQVAIWHVRTTQERKGTIVGLGGIGDNKSRYVLGIPIVVDDGWDMVMLDYQGFGDSTGSASLEGAVRSSRVAFDYALSQDDTVVGYGFSFGTAVLARIAADYDLAGCIFDGTLNLWETPSLYIKDQGFYDPVIDFGDFDPFIRYFDVPLFILGTPADYDIKRWIRMAEEPKLFIHSPEDSINPYQGAWEVFQNAPEPKYLFTTRGGEYMTYVFQDPILYHAVVNGWLDGVVCHDPMSGDPDIPCDDDTGRSAAADREHSPEEIVLPAGEDDLVSVWRVRAPGERRGILVVLTDRSDNAARRISALPFVVDAGWDMVMPDYLSGTVEDAVARARVAFDFARSQNEKVVGIGCGFGSAVLARIASDYELAACVFDRSSREGDTEHWISTVTEPKLFIHSPDDPDSPYEGAWAVYQQATQPKFFYTRQSENASSVFDPAFYGCVDGWIEGVLNRAPLHSPEYGDFMIRELQSYEESLLNWLPSFE